MRRYCSSPLIILTASILHSQPVPREDTTKTYVGKEVVVTSTRGSGEVLEVPLAVGVVNVRSLLPGRDIGINEALSLVPGVFAQSRAGGTDVRLTIRGFGARGSGDRSNAATVRGIKIMLDGIPETEPDGRTPLDLIDLNAIDKIEVVRSNASTLFGNASGGVINLETMSSFHGHFVETANSFGDFLFRNNNVSAGTSLGSTRLFASATNSTFGGWRQNSQSQSTKFHSSIISQLEKGTNLRFLAGGVSNTFHIPGALTQQQFEIDPTQANPVYLARKERRMNTMGRIAFDLSAAVGDHHLIDILAYVSPKVLARSERGTFRDFNRYHIGGGAVYAWMGSSTDVLRKILVGADDAYQDGTILFYSLVNGERGDSLRTNKREAAETFGVFSQVELHLSDQVNITLGGRFDRQRYASEERASAVKRRNGSEHLSFSHFTPKISTLYRVSVNHSVYASMGGGLEAPAFNEVDPPPNLSNALLNPVLSPMLSTTYEIGAKGFELVGNDEFIQAFSYSFAAYRITIKNEIVPYNGGSYFFSAGQSRRLGLEASAQVYLPSGFSVTTAFTYLDAKYDSYANDQGNFAGNDVPGIPPIVFNTRLRYESELGITAETACEHVGEYAIDDANAFMVSMATVFNASVGYSFSLAGLTCSAFGGVNNLTNLKHAASAFINPVEGSYLEPGLPRNLYGGFQAKLTL